MRSRGNRAARREHSICRILRSIGSRHLLRKKPLLCVLQERSEREGDAQDLPERMRALLTRRLLSHSRIALARSEIQC